MIKKVLIANRGEIAMRILRTLKKMNIKSVAVHSSEDSKAMHVRFADESVCIGPSQASASYNNIKNIIAAAELTGADAIHPGYGFLSEDGTFANIVKQHKMIFIGPSEKNINELGNKINAKKIMQKAKIPVVPGSEEAIEEAEEAYKIAKTMIFPILIKATDCGGGKGQRIVTSISNFKEKFEETQKEAIAISNKKGLFIETYFQNPKHIEFQMLGDGKGNVICLGTRDCSIQRRHQKVLEEAPANISKKQENSIRKKLCKVLGKHKYKSAGTVEFLEYENKLYFIEINTRIQVEHPVTEAITGLDLIEMQINIENNKGIPKQKEIKFKGHAIESRITAEDSFTFIPCPGKITEFLAPGGPNIRVDSALYPSWVISPNYDSLVAKIISYASTREECIKIHKQALKETTIIGISTSLELHQWLLEQQVFEEANFSTQWLEQAISILK